MKSFSLSAFVGLALVLTVSAAPTSTSVKTTHVVAREEAVPSDEEFIGPLLRIGGILSKLPKAAAQVARAADDDLETDKKEPKKSIRKSKVKDLKVAPPAPEAADDNDGASDAAEAADLSDVAGTAYDVLSDALPEVGSVLEDLAFRDIQNADKKGPKKHVKKSKAKILKAATPAPEAAADDEAATAATDATDATDAAASDAAAAVDDIPTEKGPKKRTKKSNAKAANPAPETEAADDEATTATTEPDASAAASPDASAATNDLSTRATDVRLPSSELLLSLLRKVAARKAAAASALAPVAETAAAAETPAAAADVVASVL